MNRLTPSNNKSRSDGGGASPLSCSLRKELGAASEWGVGGHVDD